MGAGVSWLLEHQPEEPQLLAVCHGDFHPLNILVEDGEVSGVLDWPGFAVADPVFDVANTIILTTIPARVLTATMPGYEHVDWGAFTQQYLSSYRQFRDLDTTNLAYYKVRRCVMGLVQAAEGTGFWGHPHIVQGLTECIQDISSIKIVLPGKDQMDS
jgi:aminoglycoside phosphotransferase (APT) family kinase protein